MTLGALKKLLVESCYYFVPVWSVCVSLCVSMHVSVCLSLSVCWHIKPHGRTSPNVLSMLPVAMAQSCSDGIEICYVLLVLRMTSCFRTMGPVGRVGMALCGLPGGVASGHGRCHAWATAAHWLTGLALLAGRLVRAVEGMSAFVLLYVYFIMVYMYCVLRQILYSF